jgi:hypothetical protein
MNKISHARRAFSEFYSSKGSSPSQSSSPGSSKQINPNQTFVVQLVVATVDDTVRDFGFLVVGLAVGLSLFLVDVDVGSRQPPNQPGYSQLCADVVGCAEVVVSVGAGAGLGVADLEVVVDSSPSKHPNHPGVLQVDVEDELVVVVVVGVVVVDSSKHPHQPGVLHVSVLVLVLLVFSLDFELVEVEACDVDGGTVELVVVSVPLLSKYCQG